VRAAILLAAAAVLAAVVPLPAGTVEAWYSRGVYPPFQRVMTSASSLVPFALFDVLLALALALSAAFVAGQWRRAGWRTAVRLTIVRLIAAASIVYLLFLACWGLNYRRAPLETRLDFDPSRIDPVAAARLARTAVERVNALATTDRSGIRDEALAPAFAAARRAIGDSDAARLAAPKRSRLTWYFRQAAIDGMTDPFFLEIIVNPDVLPFERPFVLAHEWAHLAGYAEESEANFVAWLTCLRSEAPLARYSGWLAAYQHASAVLPREERRALRAALHPSIAGDLQASAARLARAQPAVRDAARGVYDKYLRANRVEDGIASYGAVLRLMLGTTLAEAGPAARPPDK
jgi:hypothetical protein